MSENDVTASDVARGEQKSASVYDFLYHDSRRIGSFLAQFDDAGHLQQVTQTDAVSKGTRRGWSASAGGGLSGVGSANASVELAPGEGGSESSARVYDPLWTNALVLLDYLTEHNLIERDISRARIGQFVLASGDMAIVDLTLVRKMWDLPSIRQEVARGARQQEGNRQERRRNKARHSGGTDNSQLLAEMMTVMPHSVQARLRDGDRNIWCTLHQGNMVVPSGDLFLKHGIAIPGRWSILGVLDALPDDAEMDLQEVTDNINSEEVGISILMGGFGALIEGFGPLIRILLGRPTDAFGLTPLLVFREVSS